MFTDVEATFTAVGYGADGFVTGTVISNHPIVLDDGIRSYRDVTAASSLLRSSDVGSHTLASW